MRLTGQLKTNEINRFRNQADFKNFKENFEPTLSPVEKALDTFKRLDNTEADGNKVKGKVALATSSGYEGFLDISGGEKHLSCEKNSGSGTLSFHQTKSGITWQTESGKIVEDKATGVTSAYTSEPAPAPPSEKKTMLEKFSNWLNEMLGNVPPAPPKPVPKPPGLEGKLEDFMGQAYQKVGSYKIADQGNFSTGAEQRAFENRVAVDNSLDFAKQLFLEHDNSGHDGNQAKGYVVLDGMKRTEGFVRHSGYDWSVGNGHLSNKPNDEVQMSGHIHRSDRETPIYYSANKINTETESLGQYRDWAYIENHETGIVTTFEAEQARR